MKMKKFNLKEAMEGKPVCTRDGRTARIICFDRKGLHNQHIVALVTEDDGYEQIFTYNTEGRWAVPIEESKTDLFMVSEKHEGWINIYPATGSYIHDRKAEFVFRTEKEALEGRRKDGIATAKIEWEE